MLSINSTAGVAGILALTYIGGAAAEEPATNSASFAGLVFEDLNGNAMRDDKEPGIAGIRVSDQVSVVSTGEDGSFLLPGDGGYGFVYVSQPAGYRVGGPFWRRIPVNGKAVEFPLTRTEQPVNFTFIHASDPHLSLETLDRMRLLREIVDEQQPAFVLITGDLIKDALRVGEEEATGLYELFVQELAKFPVPVWTTLGNHEIFGIERHHSLVSPDHPLYGKQMYRHYLGPNYYSFDFGGIRFIGLDTVDYDDLWYNGYVDEVQMAWLREELASLVPETPVVTFNHIPLLSAGEIVYGFHDGGPAPSLITVDGETRFRHTVGNARAVLTELRQHRFDLALSGHFHMREELFFESHGVKTRFYMTSAVRDDSLDRTGLDMISGVTLYRVDNSEIDNGTFIPLDSVP
jgi:predicted MPP superfamily phosphohydrolase